MTPAMKQREAMFRAILANPAALAPRLRYADWLEENGQTARAEFIRLQILRARARGDDPRQPGWGKREHELLWKHQEEWLKELPEWAQMGAEFRRGFVAYVWRATAKQFLADGEYVRRVTPLQGLGIDRVGSLAKALATSPLLAG